MHQFSESGLKDWTSQFSLNHIVYKQENSVVIWWQNIKFIRHTQLSLTKHNVILLEVKSELIFEMLAQSLRAFIWPEKAIKLYTPQIKEEGGTCQ